MNKENSILIIDDEVQIRRLLEITLQSNGFETIEAVSGKEGLNLAASHQPALIILDLGLPDSPGHEVLKRLCKGALLFDVGNERKTGKDGWNNWMGTAAFFQYTFATTFSVAARME